MLLLLRDYRPPTLGREAALRLPSVGCLLHIENAEGDVDRTVVVAVVELITNCLRGWLSSVQRGHEEDCAKLLLLRPCLDTCMNP